MAKQPAPAQVSKKVSASVVTTPAALVSTNAKFEFVVQLGNNGDYEVEKILVQGQAA